MLNISCFCRPYIRFCVVRNVLGQQCQSAYNFARLYCSPPKEKVFSLKKDCLLLRISFPSLLNGNESQSLVSLVNDAVPVPPADMKRKKKKKHKTEEHIVLKSNNSHQSKFKKFLKRNRGKDKLFLGATMSKSECEGTSSAALAEDDDLAVVFDTRHDRNDIEEITLSDSEDLESTSLRPEYMRYGEKISQPSTVYNIPLPSSTIMTSKTETTEQLRFSANSNQVRPNAECTSRQPTYKEPFYTRPPSANQVMTSEARTNEQPDSPVEIVCRQPKMPFEIALPTYKQPYCFRKEVSKDDCYRKQVSKNRRHSDYEREANVINSVRRWEHVTSRREIAPNRKETSFIVMSYNVLAQRLLEDHLYLYRNHDRRAISWDYRSNLLLRELKDANADILCLQEVQYSHLDSFYSQLRSLGYQGLFKQRTNGKVDGCAIYFKSDKFTLLENTSVEYYQPGDYLMDRDNVGLIARLQVRGTRDQQLVVATTHLLYNPKRHDVKLGQTQLLLTEIERVSYIGHDKDGKSKYWPVVLTGDFNLPPFSAVYHFITNGSLEYSVLASKSLQLPLYGQALQRRLLSNHMEISNESQHISVVKLRGSDRKRQVTEEALLEELNLLKFYNSDHQREIIRWERKQSSQVSSSSSNDAVMINTERIESGKIHHGFNLKSVYEHGVVVPPNPIPLPEATTHQDDWVTVDYMFYSDVSSRLGHDIQGRLHLMSRYTLPTKNQCHEIKRLPNLACASDHLPLIARFLLVNDQN